MNKTLIAALAAALAAAPVYAADVQYNMVEFSESAGVEVDNDTQNVVLRVMETGKSRSEISDKVTRRVNAVLARAKAVRTLEAESGNRHVYPEYEDNKGTIRSWTDSADIVIKSADFDALAKLVADSRKDAMPVNMYFSVSPAKNAAAVEEASGKVLQTFRQRAQNLSRQLGFSGYKIVKIDLSESFENTQEAGMAAPAAASVRLLSAKSAAPEIMDAAAGKRRIVQTIRATVQMQ